METKERILDAAEALFAEQGPTAASLREVARQAGFDSSTLNYHFSKREKLLAAVLDRRLEPLCEERLRLLKEAQEHARPGPPALEDVLRAYFGPAVQLFQSQQYGLAWERLALWMRMNPDEFAAGLRRAYEEVVPAFLRVLERTLPELPPDTLRSRFHLAVRVEVGTATDKLLVERLDGNAVMPQGTDELVSFAAAGIRAATEAPVSPQVRSLETHEDFSAAVSLQRRAWGFEDQDILPEHLMRAYRDWGLQRGAFAGARSKLVGLALGYPTHLPRVLLLHMLAADPSCRGEGIGRHLLRDLEEQMHARKLRGLVWTYDPLDAVNAHIYHNRFGGVGVQAKKNYYVLHSEHHAGLPAHRLLALRTASPSDSDRQVTQQVELPGTSSELKESARGAEMCDAFFDELAEVMDSRGLVVVGFKRALMNSPAELLLGPPTEEEQLLMRELLCLGPDSLT